MKKNLLIVIATFCAIVVCFGIYAYQTFTKSTDLMRLNIEALAGNDIGKDGPKLCYVSITTWPEVQARFCGTCSYIENSRPLNYDETGSCTE